MNQIRQGDVLLISIEDNDTHGYSPVGRDGGRIVLAYGEATGHAHAITEPNAVLLQKSNDEDDRILRVEGNVVYLRHEEHDKHALSAGLYRVRLQREWSIEDQFRVAD